eukprot:jgi/Bigna1/129948/aug1.10_g4656
MYYSQVGTNYNRKHPFIYGRNKTYLKTFIKNGKIYLYSKNDSNQTIMTEMTDAQRHIVNPIDHENAKKQKEENDNESYYRDSILYGKQKKASEARDNVEVAEVTEDVVNEDDDTDVPDVTREQINEERDSFQKQMNDLDEQKRQQSNQGNIVGFGNDRVKAISFTEAESLGFFNNQPIAGGVPSGVPSLNYEGGKEGQPQFEPTNSSTAMLGGVGALFTLVKVFREPLNRVGKRIRYAGNRMLDAAGFGESIADEKDVVAPGVKASAAVGTVPLATPVAVAPKEVTETATTPIGSDTAPAFSEPSSAGAVAPKEVTETSTTPIGLPDTKHTGSDTAPAFSEPSSAGTVPLATPVAVAPEKKTGKKTVATTEKTIPIESSDKKHTGSDTAPTFPGASPATPLAVSAKPAKTKASQLFYTGVVPPNMQRLNDGFFLYW